MRWYDIVYLTRLLVFVDSKINDTVADGGDEWEGRIVGGVRASIKEFPSTVLFSNMGALCAGTILTNHAVLTAAHCFTSNKDVENMMILAGSRYRTDPRAKLYRVEYYIAHEDYSKSLMFACDIAIIFVKNPITLGPKAKRAVIVNNNKWMNIKELKFTVTGWGRTKQNGFASEGLQMTHLRFVPRNKCAKMHKTDFTKDMFCLYGDAKRDACHGDSGGGVLWKGMLVGIVSHGDGCAQPDKPTVYANVWHFRKWIHKHLTHFYDKYYCKRIAPKLKRKIKNRGVYKRLLQIKNIN